MALLTANVEVESVLHYAAQTGESPFWSVAEQALYWIDIQQPALHRYEPASGQDRHWIMPDEIGCYALRHDGSGAILGLRSGLHELRFATGAITPLTPPPFDPSLFRFNEGGCDCTGRFWLGTMFDPKDKRRKDEHRQGQWHSYTEAEGLRPRPDFAVIPNGLAWDDSFQTMYTAHYERGEILAFDFDAQRGRLGRQRIFATIPHEAGRPDGSAIDAEGCYWVALHDGARLRRFRPDGSFDSDLPLPVSQPTMCAFGDADLSTLYITSAAMGLAPEQKAREPLAGRLLRCRPGVRGRALPMFGATTAAR